MVANPSAVWKSMHKKLPIGQNGSYGHAALNWKIFKISLWDSLESDYHKLSRFPFNRLYDDSLCLCTLWEKEQLAVKLPDDFSAKYHRASWYTWFFRQKYAFGLLRELLYWNEL